MVAICLQHVAKRQVRPSRCIGFGATDGRVSNIQFQIAYTNQSFKQKEHFISRVFVSQFYLRIKLCTFMYQLRTHVFCYVVSCLFVELLSERVMYLSMLLLLLVHMFIHLVSHSCM